VFFAKAQDLNLQGVDLPSLPTLAKPINQMSAPELKSKIQEITAAIQQLQNILASVKAQSGISNIPSDYTFSQNIMYGQLSPDVKYLQIILNQNPSTRISNIGPGSPGQETTYFGLKTKQALLKFQEQYKQEIPLPLNLQNVGYVESNTQAKLNTLLQQYRSTVAPTTPTTPAQPTQPTQPAQPIAPSSPTPMTFICGNSKKETGETCDGTDLAEFGNGINKCSLYSSSFQSGNLFCSSDCKTIITSSCVALTPPLPTLLVDLRVSSDSSNWQNIVTGAAPLNNVDLRASVSGTATGTINYSFDCQNDGIWDSPDNSQYKGISATTKEFTNGCNYPTAGTYVARVKAERNIAPASYNTVTIIVNPAPVLCAPTTCLAQDRNCGSLPDGCGAILNCGTCNTGYSCNNNVCALNPVIPPTLTPTITPTPSCGDNACNGTEACSTCPGDCGVCPTINMAPYAKITTTPYTSLLSRITDSSPGSGVTPENNDYFTNITYEFRFDRALSAEKISFTLPPKNYSLWADTTGNGVYDTKLVEVINGPSYGYWHVSNWHYDEWSASPKKSLYAVKLVEPKSGYQSLFDFQIICEEDSAASQLIASNPATLESGVSTISVGSVVTVLDPSARDQYLKGVYIEPWMFDWNGWINSSPRGNLMDWPAYKSMLAIIRGVGANLVWMMPIRVGEDCYTGPVPWPSQYIANSSPENYLAMLATALHADGIKIFVGDRPGGTLWPYPDWFAKSGVNQSDVFDNGIAEMAVSGIDGVAVCADEVCHGNPIQTAVKAKAANSNILTFLNYSWDPELGNSIYIDFLGLEGYFTKEDYFGHWTAALNTARAIGANLNKGTIITQGNGWTSIPTDPSDAARLDAYPKASMYGSILSTVSHGGNAQAFWRLTDFLISNPVYRNATAEGYSMLDTLASWGGKNATVSNKIVVLDSYISEGGENSTWTYITSLNKSNENWVAEASRNRASERAVYETLLTNGYPFKVGYLEFPNTVDLSGAKTVIIPFPYNNFWKINISDQVITRLNQVAAAGTKIIILGYPGTVYSGFNSLVQSPNVTVLTDNILYGITKDFSNHFLSVLDSSLGIDKPVYLKNYGNDIEVASLEKSDSEKFLFVTNWESQPVAFDVGVNMPAGNYNMQQRDLNGVNNVLISGSQIFTKQDLAKFRVTLAAQESRIFYISPAAMAKARTEMQEQKLSGLALY